MTYADLAVDPRYTAAIQFFQNDLYGAADFSRRDADLARVVPVLVRVLPEAVIMTAASAMELNALSQELDPLSQELDRVLLTRLPRADGYFSVAEYCKAYRRAGNYLLRERQIKLIVDIGTALDRSVGKPLVRTALTMMRQPARLAGLSRCRIFSSGVLPHSAKWVAPRPSLRPSRSASRRYWNRSPAARRIRFPTRLHQGWPSRCRCAGRPEPAARSGLAHELVELCRDLFLEERFERRQQPSEIDVEGDVVLADDHRA